MREAPLANRPDGCGAHFRGAAGPGHLPCFSEARRLSTVAYTGHSDRCSAAAWRLPAPAVGQVQVASAALMLGGGLGAVVGLAVVVPFGAATVFAVTGSPTFTVTTPV